MKKIAVIIMAVIITCIALVGCGSEGYAGKWELQEMTGSGMTITDNFMGIPLAVVFQREFKDDGTGSLFQNSSGTDQQDTSFKWEEKDGGIVLTKNGTNEELKFTKEGDLLVTSTSVSGTEYSYKLKKVDSFTTFDASSFSFGS